MATYRQKGLEELAFCHLCVTRESCGNHVEPYLKDWLPILIPSIVTHCIVPSPEPMNRKSACLENGQRKKRLCYKQRLFHPDFSANSILASLGTSLFCHDTVFSLETMCVSIWV